MKQFEKQLRKVIPKISKGQFNFEQQEKIIKNTIKAYNIISTILKVLILLWIFRRTYDRIGFEMTVIVLLTLILAFLRNKI